jgi:hypothetical protein
VNTGHGRRPLGQRAPSGERWQVSNQGRELFLSRRAIRRIETRLELLLREIVGGEVLAQDGHDTLSLATQRYGVMLFRFRHRRSFPSS